MSIRRSKRSPDPAGSADFVMNVACAGRNGQPKCMEKR